MQNPANIGKPAGVGETRRTPGKGGSPTRATSAAVGQADVARKGRNPQGQPAAGEAPQTVGAGRRARHKAKTKRRMKDTSNPTDIAPLQEQDRQLEPEGIVTSKGNLRQETQRKTADAARRGTEGKPKKRCNKRLPRAEQEERSRTRLCRI